MNRNDHCLDGSAVRRLVAERHPPEKLRRLAAHLASCSRCRERIVATALEETSSPTVAEDMPAGIIPEGAHVVTAWRSHSSWLGYLVLAAMIAAGGWWDLVVDDRQQPAPLRLYSKLAPENPVDRESTGRLPAAPPATTTSIGSGCVSPSVDTVRQAPPASSRARAVHTVPAPRKTIREAAPRAGQSPRATATPLATSAEALVINGHRIRTNLDPTP